jgi:hypothetical protein
MPDVTQNTVGTSSRCLDNTSAQRLGNDWELEVEHGPNWLFVRVTDEPNRASASVSLAEQITSLLEEHFTTRIVLEFDQIDMPYNQLISELESLEEWVGGHQGVLRLCGLSPACVRAIAGRGLGDRLPMCHNREEAVFSCYRPGRPR